MKSPPTRSSRFVKILWVIGVLALITITLIWNIRVAVENALIMRHAMGVDKPDDDDATDSSSVQTKRPRSHVDTQMAPTKDAHSHEEETATSPSSEKNYDLNVAAPLVWNRSVYLPADDPAVVAAFQKYEDRQKVRIASWHRRFIWPKIQLGSSREKQCFENTPECEFFRELKRPLLLDKCCEEHRKLKAALQRVLHVADKAGLELFLDSGTLLSAARDGGHTLVPQETDIDLGIVGAWPRKVDEAFQRFNNKKDGIGGGGAGGDDDGSRRHFFASCRRKVSANSSRHGTCGDAFYLYYASNAADAMIDTCRVEIWPFREDGPTLVHPTRVKKLSVPRQWVVPLSKEIRDDQSGDGGGGGSGGGRSRRCKIWGMSVLCPHQTVRYLDNEYGPTWRWPRTIHWDKNNAPPWNVHKKHN